MLLIESPADSTDDLKCSDGASKSRSLLQFAHKVLPEFGAVFPGEGVVFGSNYSHDAIADEGHGCEMFPASRCKGH